ncbi:MAG: acyl--CoA ligase [Deltaproteobacteria bacterium]|nr:acyl--CoA ligase [Deltaproteobacteria bacterium]
MLISQIFAPVALKNGAKIAFKYLDNGYTYKDFWETSSRFSYYLQKEIGHGLRVGLWMSACPQLACSIIALTNTKSCVVPLNPTAVPADNLFKIKDAGITVILCSSDHLKALNTLLRENGLSAIKVIDIESKRCAEYDPTYSPPAAHVPVEKDEILLLYTPGTSGKVKGCLFNHTALIQAVNSVKMAAKLNGTDTVFTQYPYSDSFNLIHFLLAPLAAGASVLLSDHTEPPAVLSQLVEQRVTRMAPLVRELEGLLTFSIENKIPIVPLKFFCIDNQLPFEKPFWDLLKRACKVAILNSYGLTEYLGTVAMSSPDTPVDAAKPGFLGPAVTAAKLRLVDDGNDEIDKKKPQLGHLLVMGPQLMSKYLNLPEEQKFAVRGTWLHTGDIVAIDSEGRVTFHDRKNDMVTVAGKKVKPREIEPVVRTIPQVAECAFIGTGDRLGKPITAVVIERVAGAKLNEVEVREHLKTRLPVQKMPGAIFFTDVMPRTPNGVINRGKLRSLFDGA